MLYASLPMLLISLFLELFAGAVVGLIAAALVLRSDLTRRKAAVPMFLSAILFLIASGFVGWADSHSAIDNGRRLDFAPWGEDLRFRNRIVEHELLIMFGSSFTGALVYSLLRKRCTPRLRG